MDCPFLSNKRKPNACSIPAPPSFVALPPIPKMICCTPRSRACLISSPVPKLVVWQGLRLSIGTRCNPDAAAISIIAVLPSPDKPKKLFTWLPNGAVTSASIKRP